MIDVSVIGLGKMGLLHASILNTFDDVRLVALCENNGMVNHFAKNVFEGIDASVVKNVSDIAEYHPDAVFVTIPPAIHYPVIKELLEDGVCGNIFVEKPLTNDFSKSQELYRLAEESKSITMVGYNRRYNVTFLKARELLAGDEFGTISGFEVHAYSSDFLDADDSNQQGSRGGLLKDLTCHAIDLGMLLIGALKTGEVVSHDVSGNGSLNAVDFEVESDNSVKGMVRSSWVKEDYRLPEIGFSAIDENGSRITATEEYLRLEIKGKEPQTLYKHHLDDKVGYWLGGAEYWRQDRAFIDSVVNGKKDNTGFLSAMKVDEIIDIVEKQID